jgi:hypothetical protein
MFKDQTRFLPSPAGSLAIDASGLSVHARDVLPCLHTKHTACIRQLDAAVLL